MLVLFTHRDDLEHHGRSIDTFVQTLPPKMKQVLQRCGNRYLAFNNRVASTAARDGQVNDLLKMIDRMVSQNGGRCFTNDVYKDFEKMIVARERKLKEKLERQKEKEMQMINERVQKEAQRQMQALQDKEREHQLQRDEADKERKRVEAEMNEKMEKKFQDLEDQYQKKSDNLRNEVRQEVQDGKEGTGDVFDKGLQLVGKGIEHVGKGIVAVGMGVKNVVASIPGKLWSSIFGN